MEAKELTNHVTRKAVSLIKKVHSPNIGAMEFSGGWSKERCDAILFSSMTSYLIETKISRSDFLADAKKPFRLNPDDGVGEYRYYACPTGLIKPEELPEKWGLIYVDPDKKNVSASMPIGFGGFVMNHKKNTKHPKYGWTVQGFDSYGTEGDPRDNNFKFNSCWKKERMYVFALATRYKQQKFMENIL